jgi:hypothetical protein
MRMVEMSPDWQFLTCRLAVLALTFLTECGCGGADTPASSLRFLEVSAHNSDLVSVPDPCILVWTQIRGFMPLTNGSGSGAKVFLSQLIAQI